MPHDPIAELRALLETERDLLLKGRIEDVAALEGRKLELADSISGLGHHDHAMLTDLQQIARRNQALLEAAEQGVRSAIVRLKDIRKATTRLETYGSDGGRKNLKSAAPKVERRA